LLSEYFLQAPNSKFTIAWQTDIEFPKNNYETKNNGVRKVSRDNNIEEMWIDIIKLNETAYQLVNVTLNNSLAT
jgi:hypothetical protein